MTTLATNADEFFKARSYARKLTPEEDGRYSASVTEFPGCFAEGDTPDEALNALDAAAIAWIEASVQSGRSVPEPLDLSDFSGKIALRMPRSLHGLAAERALLESSSLNQLLVTAIAHYLGQSDGLARSMSRLNAAAMSLSGIVWHSQSAHIDFFKLAGSEPIRAKPARELQSHQNTPLVIQYVQSVGAVHA